MSLRWIVVVVMMVFRAAAVAAVTVDELPPDGVYSVARIRVEGTSTVAASAIRAVMQTKIPPWYLPWKRWLTPTIFDARLFRTDLQRIGVWLREAGHYEATVSHDLVLDGKTVTIVITIEEGPAVRVKSVDLDPTDFTPTTTEATAFRTEVPLALDAVFTQDGYDAGRNRLELRLQRAGYAYAKVEKSALVDTATHEVAVRYGLTRGIPAVFGTTYVTGTDKVAVGLVRREIAFRPGEAYDPAKLDETQARIFGLRLFRSVTIRPRNLADMSGTVDVAITVVEGLPRELIAGLGYGLEDEVRGQLQWQHNDFFGGGRQLGVRIKGSKIEQSVQGEFRQPYFLQPQQTFIAPLTQLRDDEPGYTVEQIRFAPRVERKLTPQLTVSAGYNVEYDSLSGVADDTIERFEDGRAAYKSHGVVSSLTAAIERNTTVDLLDPHDGSVLNATVEQAGGPWQGAFSFYTAVVEAKKYVPLPGRRTLAGRLRLGTGDGFGQSRDLPLFRRFFAGGITSTRGYGRHLVGPLNDDDEPIGGRSVLDGSVELRTPVYGSFGGVVFFDVGAVSKTTWALGDLQFGTGVGVRYATPVGPLRVDFGIPLEPPPGEPHWQVHFSIGQAF